MGEIIGVDLDGTIAEHPGYGLRGEKLLDAYMDVKGKNHELALAAAVVITSRNVRHNNLTTSWIKEQHGRDIPVEAYNSKSSGRKCVRTIVKHKLDNIKKYGVTTYYDDELPIITLIAKKTGGTVTDEKGIYKLVIGE